MILPDVLLNGAVYVLIGVFAGVMAGILGIGGGVIVVPGLAYIFQYNHMIPEQLIMSTAAGSSLAIMIFTTQSSLKAHLKMGEVLWTVFNELWPGIVLGVISGALLASFIPIHWLKCIFSIFLYLVALKMLAEIKVTQPGRFPRKWITRMVSYFIGLMSGMLGVGGGILTVPFLTYCGVDLRKIAAVSNLCTLTVALVGTLVFMMTGYRAMNTVSYSTGYIYWPAVLAVAIPSFIAAPWGAKLNYVLPVTQLKFVFIVILIVTATHMLF